MTAARTDTRDNHVDTGDRGRAQGPLMALSPRGVHTISNFFLKKVGTFLPVILTTCAMSQGLLCPCDAPRHSGFNKLMINNLRTSQKQYLSILDTKVHKTNYFSLLLHDEECLRSTQTSVGAENLNQLFLNVIIVLMTESRFCLVTVFTLHTVTTDQGGPGRRYPHSIDLD